MRQPDYSHLRDTGVRSARRWGERQQPSVLPLEVGMAIYPLHIMKWPPARACAQMR